MKYKLIIFFIVVCNFLGFSQSAVDYYNKGKEEYFSENYDNAVYNFKKSLEINANYLEPMLELSRLYYDIENYNYAYSYITKALKIAPANDDSIIFSANIDTKLHRYDIAESKYKKILAKNPLNIDAYDGLANLYLETNRKILAKKALDEIIKTEPGNFKAISMMAKYYEPIDRHKAEKYYLMNIENNSLNPESYFQYSVFNFKNSDFSKAVENINTANKIKTTLKYKKYYGKYQLFLNKGDESLKTFKDILKSGEVDYLNYYHLAYSYYLISDYNQAKTSLMKAIGLRDDDEASSFFLNQILSNKFSVDDEARKGRSAYYFKKAVRAKQEANFDLYIFNLKESIRIYPKNVDARIELAEYYKSLKLPERYLRELKVAQKYTNDVNLSDRIEIEESMVAYKLGDDWEVNQYVVPQDVYTIPMFVIGEINNPHYNFEKIYGRVIVEMAYENLKYEIEIVDDKTYSASEKMEIAKEKQTPFYIDLYAREDGTAVDVSFRLINSGNNQLLREYNNYQVGNDKIALTCQAILKRLDKDIPFRAHILKINKDKAIINAGRRSGIKLKDSFVILNKKNYIIEMDRSNFIYSSDDVKGTAFVTKVDENISEISIKDNDYFKDIDIDDIIIYK